MNNYLLCFDNGFTRNHNFRGPEIGTSHTRHQGCQLGSGTTDSSGTHDTFLDRCDNLHVHFMQEERRRIVIYVCGHVTRTGDSDGTAQTIRYGILLEICFRSQTRCGAVIEAQGRQVGVWMSRVLPAARGNAFLCYIYWFNVCTAIHQLSPRLEARLRMHLTTTRNGLIALDCLF